MPNQGSHVIDVTRSFVVTDPNAFPNNQGYTAQEDSPEKEPPILAYEGVNFLPTSYGYKSFFGTSSLLNIAPLLSRCDRVLLYQFGTYENVLVALCEDGIWTCRPNVVASPWVHNIVQAIPPVGTYLEFTYCVIENKLYIYRERTSLVHRLDPLAITPPVPQILTAGAFTIGMSYTILTPGTTDFTLIGAANSLVGTVFTATGIGAGTGTAGDNTPAGTITFVSFTPSFLNMIGQLGIFRANGRLGFWDSANSISWSNVFDHKDFTPSITTLAGNAIFNGVVGRIVTIKAQGDGFIIYSTKSIVGVHYLASGTQLWDATTITDNAGIWYDREVTCGVTELEHYVYTTSGIKKIGAFNALNRSHSFEDIIPDIYDLLKESRQPIYLDFINGRFLVLHLISADYVDAKVSFSYNTIGAIPVIIKLNGIGWNGLDLLPSLVITTAGTTIGITSWIASGINAVDPLGTNPVAISNAVAEWDTSFGGRLGYEDIGSKNPLTGTYATGAMSGRLSADIAAQIAVWNAISSNAVIGAANAMLGYPQVFPWTYDSGNYYTMGTAMNMLALAQASPRLSVSYTRWATGAVIVTGPVIVGVSTNHPTITMSMDINSGVDITIWDNRVYRIKTLPSIISGFRGVI